MRVLHIGKYFPPVKGGMERFLEDLILAQHAAGQASFALVHQPKLVVQAELNSNPDWLRSVPVALNVSFAPIAPQFVHALNRAIDDWQPDYLHLHLPNASAIAALLSRKARRLPWVIHWHSDVVSSAHSLALRVLYPLYRPFERALLERAALVICTSNAYRETSVALEPFIEKCVVVPLGLDVRRMDGAGPTNAEAEVPWRSGAFRLLAIGRLTYYKGFDTLIKAVAQCPEVELRIVGGGSDRESLGELIRALGLQDRVFLEGELSDADCLRRLRSAELFCMPSRERTEAFGLVALEAMAHRLPVLASALTGSGLTSVVQHRETGFLAAVDAPDAWAVAITELQQNPALRSALGSAGLARLHAHFEIDAVEANLRATIDSTLSPDAPRPEAHERPLVVIPAKNEAATIAQVVQRVLAQGFADVVVVDDASADDTGQAARNAGAVVLAAPLPQGAWGAMQTGIRYGMRHNFTSVITIDADGQHRPEEIARLLEAARFADVVIGACPSRGSPARKFAWAFFRRLTGFSLEDLTSGFRLYNARACAVLAGEEATLIDYQDMGVLLLLRSAGVTFAEVEVQMNPREDGVSRIFYSWWAVARYMLETTVLCIAKGVPRGRLRLLKSARKA
jgi:glycosyltransferase involved in cell wall biosynthesis